MLIVRLVSLRVVYISFTVGFVSEQGSAPAGARPLGTPANQLSPAARLLGVFRRPQALKSLTKLLTGAADNLIKAKSFHQALHSMKADNCFYLTSDGLIELNKTYASLTIITPLKIPIAIPQITSVR